MADVPRKKPKSLTFVQPLAEDEVIDPRVWERLNLLPFEVSGPGGLSGAEGVRPALPKVVMDLLSALALPGDVASGQVDPMGPEGLERALGFATNLSMPGLGGAAANAIGQGVDPNTLGAMGGWTGRFKLWDHLSKKGVAEADMPLPVRDKSWLDAVDMQQQGAPIEDIYDKTGWFPGAVDKKLRFEIPDLPSIGTAFPDVDAMVAKRFEELSKMTYFGTLPEDKRMEAARASAYWAPNASNVPFGAVIDDPFLFAAYPEIANISTDAAAYPSARHEGSYWTTIPPSIRAQGSTNADLISVLLHEGAGHGVQDIEGFTPGGNPADMQYVLEKLGLMEPSGVYNQSGQPEYQPIAGYPSAYQLYRALGGEVEARNVQNRWQMAANQGTWEGLPEPWKTEDVPRELQFDPFALRNAMNLPFFAGAVSTSGVSADQELNDVLKKLRELRTFMGNP